MTPKKISCLNAVSFNATLMPAIVYRVADIKWLISPFILICVSPLIC